MRYQISSKTSGAVLGTYEGDSPAAALDAMAQDAGYADHREACIQSGDDGAHLVVTAVDPLIEHAKAMAEAFVEEFGAAWNDETDGDWDSAAFEDAPSPRDFSAWKAAFVAETERLAAHG